MDNELRKALYTILNAEPDFEVAVNRIQSEFGPLDGEQIEQLKEWHGELYERT